MVSIYIFKFNKTTKFRRKREIVIYGNKSIDTINKTYGWFVSRFIEWLHDIQIHH